MLKTPEINASELYAPKLCIKLGIIFILNVLNIITPKLFFSTVISLSNMFYAIAYFSVDLTSFITQYI